MKRDGTSIYEFLKLNSEQQNDAWYDWFCSDKALPNKTKQLVNKLKQIALSRKIDINNNYVFFKNNCPCAGSLYDDFRICDLKTGDVIYTIIPEIGYDSSKKELKEGKRKGLSEVWGKENGFKEALVIGNWKDVLNFFGV